MIDILKIVLPAFIVMLLALFFFDRLTNQKNQKYNSQNQVEKNKILLPLKIKAYERLIVMLERIRPQGLVMRTNNGQQTSGQLQLQLLKAVREEFEHNISLQMYVSDRVWQTVVMAKEETLQLIKVAASKSQPNGSAMQLSQEIFSLEEQVGSSAIELALKALKLEIRSEFQ